MKRRFTKFLALGLAASMVLSLTGCGGSAAATSAKSGEDVTLNFYIWSDEENYIRKVVDAYNAEGRGTTVNLNVVPANDYDDKLKVMLAGETDADLVDIRGVAQSTQYAEAGALLDLTDRVAKDESIDTSKYGSMWETSAVNGKFYALPTRTTCWALFYNPDLLKEAGVEAPGQLTWEEYIDYSLKVAEGLKGKTAADGSPLYAGFWVPWIYVFYAVQHGEYADVSDTTNLRKSIELLNTLWTNGSHYSYADVQSGIYDYISEFENGHVALLPNGEWCVNMIMQATEKGETNVNWEVAPMPVPEGVTAGTSWGQFQFAAITSGTKHPDEAYDFLSYLCGEKGSSIYASTGMIHAYSNDAAKKSLIEASGKESAAVLFDAIKVQEQPNTTNYSEYLNVFNENAQLYFLGEEDIDKCMADFEAQAAGIGQ
ncbi:MAG: sugar ABC transporter substrate-binding protein [Lachnospiraceae bacterium]|nr:sugar ABC transporter substrate-binding protein [Lachnospiraceae bacterium]